MSRWRCHDDDDSNATPPPAFLSEICCKCSRVGDYVHPCPLYSLPSLSRLRLPSFLTSLNTIRHVLSLLSISCRANLYHPEVWADPWHSSMPTLCLPGPVYRERECGGGWREETLGEREKHKKDTYSFPPIQCVCFIQIVRSLKKDTRCRALSLVITHHSTV